MKHLHGIASGNLWSAKGRYPQMKRPPALLRESTEATKAAGAGGILGHNPGRRGCGDLLRNAGAPATRMVFTNPAAVLAE
jgi:hypothetical protein